MKQNFNPARRHWGQDISRVLILILLTVGLFTLLNKNLWAGHALPQFAGTTGYREDSWTLKKGDEVLETDLTLPAFRHLKTGETYSISAVLTYDGSKDQVPACSFFVDHMFCAAYLDGEPLFRYTEEDIHCDDKGKSPGNVYAAFLLPADCLGKELEVQFIPALGHNIDFQLPTPSFGNLPTTAVSTFFSELPHNVIVVLAGFLGVVSILFATFALPMPKYREGMFIGIFAILFCLYNITESDFDFYMISNPYFTYVLDYTCFTLLPVFLMAFLRERLDPRQKPCITFMILMGFFMYALEMALHFTGTMDMREFLPYIHLVFFADFLTIFLLLITMKRNPTKTSLLLQIVPILIGMCIDAAVYYKHWQLGSSDSTFTCIGVLFFLIIELNHVWKYSIEVYTESIRSQNYRQMAYIDALTGIGNRRAFDVEKKAIRDGVRKFDSLIIASADLNDLKITNDTMGHAAGDFLIRKAAGVLAELSENSGPAFRIGGDEFAVILYNMDEEGFQERVQRMKGRILSINGKSEAKLSLALGHAFLEGQDLEACIQSADQKMYQDKARIKAEKAKSAVIS